ncbi:mandelate racemase/muconate lactonizing enzyme family protein [Tepidanaerobacter sp. EBM-38]|uniref:mandelate racemase/muconate lactonizing enzyme family protein n=1 Tax=Tepidanaerobacter sp. EBM-38 TaxID=1918496 RepID=UPI000B1E4373|nr:mandelate racemase/muconate lactonizing enzyme family protein [Tepidanaerobacter sp. EBM-38]
MKITDIKIIYAKHYLFVHIYTDEGIVGLGEAGNWAYPSSTAAAINKFAYYLIGKDPFTIEDINQNFLRSTYFRGSVIMSAISAIDIALWDIKGKKLGVPVYELLGGKTREKVRVYASVMTKTEDLKELGEKYLELKKSGFTAAKIFVNGPIKSANEGRDEFFSSRIENELERVRVCREAVGNDFDFILEAHRGMTVPEAIAFGRAVEVYRPMVFEDPIRPDNIDSIAEVAAKICIPIATGERYISLGEFEMLLTRRAAQYIRPDVCAIGGITVSKKICALAEAHDVMVIPHNPLGPVSTAACLQICATIPNLGIEELPDFCLNGAEDKMVKKPLQVENGYILIPDAPGIGIELAENAAELYPFVERGSSDAKRAFDGSVKDW